MQTLFLNTQEVNGIYSHDRALKSSVYTGSPESRHYWRHHWMNDANIVQIRKTLEDVLKFSYPVNFQQMVRIARLGLKKVSEGRSLSATEATNVLNFLHPTLMTENVDNNSGKLHYAGVIIKDGRDKHGAMLQHHAICRTDVTDDLDIYALMFKHLPDSIGTGFELSAIDERLFVLARSKYKIKLSICRKLTMVLELMTSK